MPVSLINVFVAAGRAFADWRRRQRAYEELMALDDHCLADLGIQRAEINAYLARGRRRGKEAVPTGAPRHPAFGRREPA
jgi:uncharacterized protein YjiS (DUF1127 family)